MILRILQNVYKTSKGIKLIWSTMIKSTVFQSGSIKGISILGYYLLLYDLLVFLIYSIRIG